MHALCLTHLWNKRFRDKGVPRALPVLHRTADLGAWLGPCAFRPTLATVPMPVATPQGDRDLRSLAMPANAQVTAEDDFFFIPGTIATPSGHRFASLGPVAAPDDARRNNL